MQEVAGIASTGTKQPSKGTGTETSRVVHTNLTRTGIAIGTAGYMSPEQVRKEKLDARTGLFDLNAAVPRRLNAVIGKALEKDRSRRYQSAAEMQADLQRVRRETHPVRPMGEGRSRQPRRFLS
jgi:serine/threonine protein kinase